MLLSDTPLDHQPTAHEPMTPAHRAWWLADGHEAVLLDSTSRPAGKGVLWVDVDSGAETHAVHDAISALGIALPREQVEDLCAPDEVCRARECDGDVRHVSTVALHTTTAAPEGHGIAFQVLETVAGPDWLLTCWHPSHPELGGEDPGDVRLMETVNSAGRASWTEGHVRTGGDLATELVLQITQRYKQSCRALESWLQDWESGFHADQNVDPQPLRHLLGLVIEARRRLAAFNNARSGTSNNRWFADLTTIKIDERADELLDHALARLQTTFENIRADMELVCMEKMVRQADAAERSSEADRKFQESLGKVSALLLVPTLIAGVFGANTALPGGGTWLGFDGMVVLMLVTSVVVYWLLVLRGRGAAQH
jgi:hypothetical protein